MGQILNKLSQHKINDLWYNMLADGSLVIDLSERKLTYSYAIPHPSLCPFAACRLPKQRSPYTV
jgi:hypothetical protein